MLTLVFFFFNDTATTEIYTLSLHDALPISAKMTLRLAFESVRILMSQGFLLPWARTACLRENWPPRKALLKPLRGTRSEEHTSELQSRLHIVCRLLLEKKKKIFTATLILSA